MSRVDLKVFSGPAEAVAELADEIVALVASRASRQRRTVLGLATGRTPLLLYRELILRHRRGEFSFGAVTTFNLDEYLGLAPDHPRSYRHFMQEHLFDHVDVDPARTHLPLGLVPDDEIPAHCSDYERAIAEAGGIDLQILGVGRTGHIGFNEPGSPRDSRTRAVDLDDLTRRDAAADFGGLDAVPRRAITMGCGTILEARRIRLLAWGQRKAGIVRDALHGPVSPAVSASFLQEHPDCRFLLDPEAASELP